MHIGWQFCERAFRVFHEGVGLFLKSNSTARRVFGPEFMISVPVVVAGNANAIQVPRNVKAYILPLRWHKLEAALVASLQ